MQVRIPDSNLPICIHLIVQYSRLSSSYCILLESMFMFNKSLKHVGQYYPSICVCVIHLEYISILTIYYGILFSHVYFMNPPYSLFKIITEIREYIILKGGGGT